MGFSRRNFLEMTALGGLAASAATAPALGWQANAPDFSRVPGVVVLHSPASTGVYLTSPNLVVLPDSRYFAMCDEFGPGVSGGTSGAAHVFASQDRGQTWRALPDVKPAYGSTLFAHRQALYLIGTTKETEDSHLIIRKSADGGQTWTASTGTGTGGLRPDLVFHSYAGNTDVGNGRLWFASAYDTLGRRNGASAARFFLMSAPSGADLLNDSSWTYSAPLDPDAALFGKDFRGLVQGTITVGPTGAPTVLYRVSYGGPREKALVAYASRDGKTLNFNPANDFINFPGGSKKFTVRHDPVTKLYWSVTNWVPKRHFGYPLGMTRNTVALIASPDLHRWTIRAVVLHHPDVQFHAFQYLDFQFDGQDMIALSRTAYDDGLGGAHSQHDSNFITFHRFRDFRGLAPKDAPDGLADEIAEWNSAR